MELSPKVQTSDARSSISAPDILGQELMMLEFKFWIPHPEYLIRIQTPHNPHNLDPDYSDSKLGDCKALIIVDFLVKYYPVMFFPAMFFPIMFIFFSPFTALTSCSKGTCMYEFVCSIHVLLAVLSW